MAEEDLQHESAVEEGLRRPPPSPERRFEAELASASESPEAGKEFIQKTLEEAKTKLAMNEALATGDEYEDARRLARESTEQASQALATLATTAETEIAQSAEVPLSEVQTQTGEVAVEGGVDVLADAMQAFDKLIEEFTANANQATPDMIKRLRALMVKAHPDRFPQDPRMAEFALMLGRLKMAFGGDTSAWKSLRGGETLAEDAQALRSKLLAVESQSETATERSLPLQETPRPSETEHAVESAEEKDMHTVLEDINQRMDARITERTRELDGLYAKAERSEADQARIDELEYANGIDRKRKDLRKAQLECMSLRKKQEEIEEKIAQVQIELQPYAGAQDQNSREELEAALARLLTEKEGIDKQFEGKVALIADLRDTMTKLAELLVRAQELQKAGGTEQVAAKAPSVSSGTGGYTELSPSAKEQKPSVLERVIDYAASPFEKWLDFTFDPDGSSKAAISRMTQWAKELGEAKQKSKQK